NYRAGSAGQSLLVHFIVSQSFNSFGNVTLQAATLSTGNVPPTAALTNVANHSVFLSPTNLSLKASAYDPDGSVTKVEFLDGATKLGEDTSSPYEFTWTNAPLGSHSFTVRATDNGGATFTSPAVDAFVTVGGGYLAGRFSTPPSAVDL